MKKTTLSPSPLNLLTTLFQYVKLCCKYRGNICDPDINRDEDETESLPTPTKNRVSPTNNTNSSANRSKSMQEIVKWNEVKQKYWASKGKVTSVDFEMSVYSVSNEKDLRSDRKQNGLYNYSNGAAKNSSNDFLSSIPLPGEVTNQRHNLVS